MIVGSFGGYLDTNQSRGGRGGGKGEDPESRGSVRAVFILFTENSGK